MASAVTPSGPLHNFRNDNNLPYYKIGGKIIYDEAEIQAWLNSNS